jgi:hypothetical protein
VLALKQPGLGFDARGPVTSASPGLPLIAAASLLVAPLDGTPEPPDAPDPLPAPDAAAPVAEAVAPLEPDAFAPLPPEVVAPLALPDISPATGIVA